MKKIIITVIVLLSSEIYTAAQQASIKGLLLNSNNEPVESASVLLYSMPDTVYKNGVISNSHGSFFIQCDLLQDYIIKISSVGYEDKIFPLTVKSIETDVGSIIMNYVSYMLDEITVSGNKPVLKMEQNKLILNVQNSFLSDIGDASDLIKRMPNVITKDDVISIFGKGTPIIYINERKITNLDDLKILTSSDVMQIELINTPGASYEADSKAVIIIKTKKNKLEGFSFSAREIIRHGKRLSSFENLNTNYKKGKFNIFVNYRGIQQKKYKEELIQENSFMDTLWVKNFDAQYKQNFNTSAVQSGFDCEFNENHTFGAQYQYSNSPFTVYPKYNVTVYANSVPDSYLTTSGKISMSGIRNSVNLFYSGKIGNKIELLSSLDYISNSTYKEQTTNEQLTDFLQTVSINSFSDFKIYSGKISLNYLITKNQQVNFGSEMSKVNGSGYLINTEEIIKNSIYENEEKKQALFAEYRLTKKFSLYLGLRYEHVQSIALEDRFNEPTVNKIYDNLFPNISFSIPLKNIETRINYSAKVQRPAFRLLNNSLDYSSRYHYEKGNPFLQPEQSNIFNCFLNWKFLSFQVDYEYIKDYIGISSWIDPETGNRTISSFINYPKYKILNISITGEKTFKSWSTQLSVGLSKPWFSTVYREQTVTYNRAYVNISNRNVLKLPQNWILYADIDYTSAGSQGTEMVYKTNSVDIDIKKSLFKNRLDISLWGYDIFNGQIYHYDRKTGVINYNKLENEDNRYVQLSITYRFNNYKRKDRENSSAKQEIERL
ncbi:MAG: outer membrane beta-barrel protein [Prevotellaceae bacterium]|jgi:hypothetical protein|nr:outer membrane beta-barrel protein [Prevotellaceae bacterium]